MTDIATSPAPEVAPEVVEGPVTLTARAADKVLELMRRSGDTDVALRIAVQAGGCSGMKYALYFDDRELDGDIAATVDGVPVRVDRMSAPYLRGTQIDWVESLMGAGFKIENPNAQNTCACGDSFH